VVVEVRRNLRLLVRPEIAAGVGMAFLLGVASLGLYTYLLPLAEEAGLGGWSLAFVWAWGVGGVLGSALVGRPVDALGSRRVLPFVLVVLVLALAGIWATALPVLWIVLLALWGAAGWSSVPALQHLLTRVRPDRAMPVVAFQMSLMYLGSSVGSALGGTLLDAGVRAAVLPGLAALVGLAALGLVPVAVRRTEQATAGRN
jgi:MFS transporter, DHA1 family, inner membrane transport protein